MYNSIGVCFLNKIVSNSSSGIKLSLFFQILKSTSSEKDIFFGKYKYFFKSSISRKDNKKNKILNSSIKNNKNKNKIVFLIKITKDIIG